MPSIRTVVVVGNGGKDGILLPVSAGMGIEVRLGPGIVTEGGGGVGDGDDVSG